jgi:hypothetical protein
MGSAASVEAQQADGPPSPRRATLLGNLMERANEKERKRKSAEDAEAAHEREQLEKQKTAVKHVHDHVFAYMPVTTEYVRYPRESPKYGSGYIWVCPNRVELEKATLEATRRESTSPLSDGRRKSIASHASNPFAGCPDGVMCDDDGNICIVRGQEHMEISHLTLIASVQIPAKPNPPVVASTTASSMTVKWEGPIGWPGIIERFEAQYRIHGPHGTDLPDMRWRALSGSDAFSTALTQQAHNTYFSFRVRCQGIAGWSPYSEPCWPERTAPEAPSRPPIPTQGGSAGAGAGPCHITVRMRLPADDGGEALAGWELRWLKVVVVAVDSGASSDADDADAPAESVSPRAKPKLVEEWHTVFEGSAPPDLEAKIDGLAAGNAHRFQCRCRNRVGFSEWSQSVDLRTQRPPVLRLATALGNWVQEWDDALGMWTYTNLTSGLVVTKKVSFRYVPLHFTRILLTV